MFLQALQADQIQQSLSSFMGDHYDQAVRDVQIIFYLRAWLALLAEEGKKLKSSAALAALHQLLMNKPHILERYLDNQSFTVVLQALQRFREQANADEPSTSQSEVQARNARIVKRCSALLVTERKRLYVQIAEQERALLDCYSWWERTQSQGWLVWSVLTAERRMIMSAKGLRALNPAFHFSDSETKALVLLARVGHVVIQYVGAQWSGLGLPVLALATDVLFSQMQYVQMLVSQWDRVLSPLLARIAPYIPKKAQARFQQLREQLQMHDEIGLLKNLDWLQSLVRFLVHIGWVRWKGGSLAVSTVAYGAVSVVGSLWSGITSGVGYVGKWFGWNKRQKVQEAQPKDREEEIERFSLLSMLGEVLSMFTYYQVSSWWVGGGDTGVRLDKGAVPTEDDLVKARETLCGHPCTDEEARAAWKERASALHPDRNETSRSAPEYWLALLGARERLERKETMSFEM